MKMKRLSVFLFAVLFNVAAHAQDTTSASKRESQKQARNRQAANARAELKEVGQEVGQAAVETGQKVKKGAQKAGAIINKEADKAGDVLEREADRLKAKRDSTRAAKRDSL